MTAEELREKLIEAVSGNMYCEKAVESILRIMREALPRPSEVREFAGMTLTPIQSAKDYYAEVIELLGGGE